MNDAFKKRKEAKISLDSLELSVKLGMTVQSGNFLRRPKFEIQMRPSPHCQSLPACSKHLY